MKGIKKYKLKKDLILNKKLIKCGDKIDAVKRHGKNKRYIVFHNTGWWSVGSHYFE